jgi:CBS domain-containing protein
VKGHARNIMTERVTAVAPDTPLEAIVRTLVAGRVSGLPVVDGQDRVVGFVSETDLTTALLRGAGTETTAREIMSGRPIVVDEFAPSDEVMSLMRESHIHHLPVVREGRLVGLITPVDVLRFFVEHVLPPVPEAG